MSEKNLYVKGASIKCKKKTKKVILYLKDGLITGHEEKIAGGVLLAIV